MEPSPRPLVVFSARRSGAGVELIGLGARCVFALTPDEVGGEEAILLIELGQDGEADPARLDAIARYAAALDRGDVVRRHAALGIVGDTNLLDPPEHIVWLEPDGVWTSWPTAEAAARAVEALRRKAAARNGTARHQATGPELLERLARERLPDLLDQLGYAHFVVTPEGRTVVTSARERELLGGPTVTELLGRSKAAWWTDPGRRASWTRELQKQRLVLNYPILLRTHQGTRRWVEADARIWDAPEGEQFIEGIYRDATHKQLDDRFTLALGAVSASDAGMRRTAEVICEQAAYLCEADACAIMLRAPEHLRVFPAHIWLRSGHWPGIQLQNHDPTSDDAPLILDEAACPWLAALGNKRWHAEPVGSTGRVVGTIFGEDARDARWLLALPLLAGLRDIAPASADNPEPVTGYLWIPMAEPLSFDPKDFDTDLESFVRLCSRQLQLAAQRDAFDLIREILLARTSISGIKDLDRALEGAREKLQARMPLEGCSIFRTGIEDRRYMLQLATSSGLLGTRKCAYELGEGLTGQVAQEGRTRSIFDVQGEVGHEDDLVERTAHPPRTWLGVPVLDRQRRPIGLIRCVNRTLGASVPSVTGFSVFDQQVLEEFASACALLIELALVQEERAHSLARIIHEIRTPSVGIRNNVLWLIRHMPASDNKISAKLQDLDLDATILLNLMDQVDHLRGRRHSNRREESRETNLASIVRKTFHQFIPEIRARGFSLSDVSIRLPQLIEFWLPRAGFAQIVLNLFMNALKYARRDRFRLIVYAERGDLGQFWRLHFQDWGIGIEAKYRDIVFYEGFRAPEARRHDARGLGFGLTISRRMAREIDGDLTLESLQDPTDFVVSIPWSRIRRHPEVT